METMSRAPVARAKRGLRALTADLVERSRTADRTANEPASVPPGPAPSCPICCGLGWITFDVAVEDERFGRAFPCRCQKAALIERKLKKMIGHEYLDRYAGYTFDTFRQRCKGDVTGKEDALLAAQQFASGISVQMDGITLPGLVFAGDFGTGKTGLAALSLFGRAAIGQSCVCIDWLDFAKRVQEGYTKGDSSELIDMAAMVDVLLIDECGRFRRDASGHPNVIPETPNKTEIFEQVIRQRYAARRATIITTNLAPSQFELFLGQYVMERVSDLCHWITVGGQGMRFQ